MGWGPDREAAGGEAGGGQASAAEDGICQRESVDLLSKPREAWERFLSTVGRRSLSPASDGECLEGSDIGGGNS